MIWALFWFTNTTMLIYRDFTHQLKGGETWNFMGLKFYLGFSGTNISSIRIGSILGFLSGWVSLW